MFIKMNQDRFYVCSEPGHPDGHTTHYRLLAGNTLKYYVVNEHRNDVRASIRVTGVVC